MDDHGKTIAAEVFGDWNQSGNAIYGKLEPDWAPEVTAE